jgi:hypothetical protein
VIKRFLRRQLRRVGQAMVAPWVPPDWEDPRCSAASKVSQANFAAQMQALARAGGPMPELACCGFRVFSQFEEDGHLLYLATVLEVTTRLFVDIGGSDGINSNCANLALNHGWHGLFIDGDQSAVRRGEAFYASHPDTFLYPPRFRHARITRENVNGLIAEAGFGGPVGVLSIDIDGNDYWVWDALTVIEPAVVVIETHIELGMRDIVVPYDPDYEYPPKTPDYFGASSIAMVRLAAHKGYRLVGGNRFGFNLFFVRNGLFENRVPAQPLETVLQHPRHHERLPLFDPIQHLPYVTPNA